MCSSFLNKLTINERRRIELSVIRSHALYNIWSSDDFLLNPHAPCFSLLLRLCSILETFQFFPCIFGKTFKRNVSYHDQSVYYCKFALNIILRIFESEVDWTELDFVSGPRQLSVTDPDTPAADLVFTLVKAPRQGNVVHASTGSRTMNVGNTFTNDDVKKIVVSHVFSFFRTILWL